MTSPFVSKLLGYPIDKIEPYLNLSEAVTNLYQTNIKKYVIANYTSLQPTRNEILKLAKETELLSNKMKKDD